LGDAPEMSSNFKPMGVDPRWLARAQRKGVRGELIKRLAELIKNADDAYDRLEQEGKKPSGIIEVAYDLISSGQGYSAKGFLVRDFGSGMSREKATQAYYGDNYGSDTSDETRNGAIGVGGKDCFHGMEDCYILTVHEGILTIIEIISMEDGRLGSRILADYETKQPLEFVNKLLVKGKLEEILLNKNQTLAMFRLPDNVHSARPDKLAEQIRQYYTLRWILESEIRKVKLVDLTNSKTVILKHNPLQGELLFGKKYEIVFNQKPYEIEIQFFKHDDELLNGHSREQGYGILIQSERGAILDNQMYGFEKDPGAAKIYGKIIFNNWKQMYRASGGEILTDNREGLDYQHPVNNNLKNFILTKLKPIIDSEREKQSENPELDKKLDSNIKKAFDMMNKISLEKPTNDTTEIFKTPPENMEFESKTITIVQKQSKTIKLYLNPGKIPTSSEISLSLIGDGITINPTSTITSPLSYDTNFDGVINDADDVPFVEIEVYAKELIEGKETKTILTAMYGEYEAKTDIFVKDEGSIYPRNGFELQPRKATIVPNKERSIRLRIDTHLIDVGTPIHLECNDERIIFKPKTLTVSGPPNVGQYITDEIIIISGKKVGIKAKLTAEAATNISSPIGQTKEIRTSVCEIIIKDKEPPKTFFKDYELRNDFDKRVRSSFAKDLGMIYIHVNAPILRYTFGPVSERTKTPKNLHEKKLEALTLLADTVIDRMTYELAKHRIESDQIDVIGEKTDAIQKEKNDLEYEHGLILFQTIIHGYARHENDLYVS